MKLLAFVVSAVIFAIATANDDPSVSLPGIEDLTPDNFDKLVNGGKHALVEFYAPWCGHCKRMVPELQKLGELIAADPRLKSRVVVGKVNADNHRSLGERFGVQGFPTIKFFGRGKSVKDNEAYEGARTAERFLDFLSKKLEADKGFARVEEMDVFAQKFVSADDKAAVVAEAEVKVGELEEDAKANGELYVAFMKKALEKGDEYLTKEYARLERLISSGSVSASKVDELARKSSVLGAFSEQ